MVNWYIVQTFSGFEHKVASTINDKIKNKELGDKIKAFKHYTTEIKKFPHPRSIESIKNLAIHRGIESGLKKAEAFTLIRSIND